MENENFMDDLYVEDLNNLYLQTGFCTVCEDGHAGCSFNENEHNWKAYEAMTDYGKERYKSLLVAEICE